MLVIALKEKLQKRAIDLHFCLDLEFEAATTSTQATLLQFIPRKKYWNLLHITRPLTRKSVKVTEWNWNVPDLPSATIVGSSQWATIYSKPATCWIQTTSLQSQRNLFLLQRSIPKKKLPLTFSLKWNSLETLAWILWTSNKRGNQFLNDWCTFIPVLRFGNRILTKYHSRSDFTCSQREKWFSGRLHSQISC